MDASPTIRLASPQVELYCDDGPQHQWWVGQVTLVESIDCPYHARVELWSEVDDYQGFLGASCELLFLRESERRRLYGLIVELEQLGERDHRFGVCLVLAPAFALLEQDCDSRIWQRRSVAQIVEELLQAKLGEYGRTFDLGEVERGQQVREYCVQYQESTAAFVARLLAEEGLFFAFDHSEAESHEVLVCREAPHGWPELENVDGSPEVPIIVRNPEQAEVESIQALAPIQRLTPGSALRRDFDWARPRELLTSAVGSADERGRDRRRFTHTDRRFEDDDLRRYAEDQFLRDAGGGACIRGTSNVMSFAAGNRFYLASGDEREGEYVLTRVEHVITHDGDHGYSNTFECVAADTPLRPQLRPRPRVLGPQTAIVVGEDEIHTDVHGRIQVQFHWEREPSYATDASCWVRCAQSWAGPGWGAQFIPRVGMEVVVEFLEGNPDRPLVTGCVYNGDNSVPFALPDDKTQSGLRTSSVPGGDGYNMLRFDDAAGQEEIFIHGQRDCNIIIEHDKSQHIGRDEHLDVTRDRSVEVGQDHSESIGANQTVSISGCQMVTVGAVADETIGAAKTLAVGAAYTVSVGAAMAVSVGGSALESVAVDKIVIVDGSSQETVTEAKSTRAKSIEEQVEVDMTTSVGRTLRVSAGKNIGFEIKHNGLIEVGDKLVLSCGKSSITLEKNGTIRLEGKKIEIKGTGDVVIKGKKVSSN